MGWRTVGLGAIMLSGLLAGSSCAADAPGKIPLDELTALKLEKAVVESKVIQMQAASALDKLQLNVNETLLEFAKVKGITLSDYDLDLEGRALIQKPVPTTTTTTVP